MTTANPAPFDLKAARRAAYAVSIGASCDRSDVAELCRMANEIAPGFDWYLYREVGDLDAARDEELALAREREAEITEERAELRAILAEATVDGIIPPVGSLGGGLRALLKAARSRVNGYGSLEAVRVALGEVAGDGLGVVEAARIAGRWKAQIDELAGVILAEFGGPTASEGAVDAAIRIMRDAKKGLKFEHERLAQIETIMEKLLGAETVNRHGLVESARMIERRLLEADRRFLKANALAEAHAVLRKVAEELGVTPEALAEDPSLARPGRGLGRPVLPPPQRVPVEGPLADLRGDVGALRGRVDELTTAHDGRLVEAETRLRDIELAVADLSVIVARLYDGADVTMVPGYPQRAVEAIERIRSRARAAG